MEQPVRDQKNYVGVVNGADETTTQRYQVVLDKNAVVQLDDLLICHQVLPDGREMDHFGIVVECSGGIEGAAYASDTERVANHTTPGMNYRLATVQTLRTNPELWIPPESGARVFRAAQGVERDTALFRDQMDGHDLNIGLDATGEPVAIDFRFLNGDLGGHASISGISGVATKTSFAMHMLYMMLETEQGNRLLGQHIGDTRCIIFNVKGEDLLHLDRVSAKFEASPEHREKWQHLGVENPGAFRSVRFNVPPSGSTSLATSVRSRGANAYRTFAITPLEFVRRGLLSFVFNEPQESQINFVIEHIRLALIKHAVPSANTPGAIILRDRATSDTLDMDAALVQLARQGPTQMEPGDTEIKTFGELMTFLATHQDRTWFPDTMGSTNEAFIRRLFAMGRRLGHLIRCDASTLELDRHINVIDINTLHYDAQRFLVGAVLESVWSEKQGSGREPLRFIVLDELNKYAPREGKSPIKDILIDIAARGRSLGVILIGCQQVASGVEPAVTDNASINVVGRLKAQHARDYRFLSPELQDRTMRLRPGMMVLEQPSVPAPLPITFPLPPFATNRGDDALGPAGDAAEAAEQQDPAAMLV